VADFEADDLPQHVQKLELAGAELRHERETWAERVVRFLTHPIVSSLLMTLGILGVIVELRTPGFGAPGSVGFLCLAMAPAVSPADQETTRRLNALRDGEAPEATVAAATEALRLGWAYGSSGTGWNEYAAARAAAVAAGVDEELLEAAEPAEADPDAWSWVRLNMAYDPIPTLERVTVPVLALFGGADRNVTPEQNLEPMRAALPATWTCSIPSRC
jgi:pimeloyl-ACP methyl ester carboxylesterase